LRPGSLREMSLAERAESLRKNLARTAKLGQSFI
jgi:hypothetical protein